VVEHHYPNIPLLVLDLFGHGLSGCPNRAYSMSLFVGQLENLLVFLKIHTINIIGFSLGGAIAVGYAAKHPEKIGKLVLIAPAGFVPFHDASKGRATGSEVNEEVELGGISPHIKYVKWIPSFLLAPLMKAMFKSAFTRPQPELPPAIPTHIREEHAKQTERLIWQSFVKKGTFHATISIVKNFPLFNMEKEYRAVQNTRVGQEAPVLLVWGSQDRVIPLKSCGAKIQSFFKNSYLFTVEDAGHVVLNEQPTVVVSAILSFLQSPPDFKFSNN
jgi:pimeloyl-ACP methyl ester carboxylesterase